MTELTISGRRSHLPADAVATLSALIASIGEPCWASGPTAAALLGLDGFVLRAPFHVTVLRGRNVTRVGHHIHTTTAMSGLDTCTIAGIPCTSGARTLIELGRESDVATMTAALDSAVRDLLTTEDFLHRRIVQLRGHGRAGIRRLLDVLAGVDATRGGHSWLERRFLSLAAAAGLPLPTMQVVLSRAGDKVIRVDGHYPGTPVVVEVLGYRFHRTNSQMQNDARRMNRLILQGFTPLQFAYSMLTTDEAGVVSVLREALTQAGHPAVA